MLPNFDQWVILVIAFAAALVLSYFMTPPVKEFAERIGAMDVPRDDRRVHDHPIPRMGGLAIVVGFVLAVLFCVPPDEKIYGILIGSLITAFMGGLDDIVTLTPWIKFLGQILAAVVVVRSGLVIDAITWSTEQTYIEISHLSGAVITIFWIVLCTNAVNLIDGLDGLAVGVSAISSCVLLVVSLLASELSVSIILASLLGACLGFLPYNLNPAKIFMGDVGSQFLGFVLSTVSILGLFKLQAVITFFLPLLALAVPLADTAFAVIRRVLKGQSPFHADRGHFHHRLLASGLSQKQAVAVLYGVSAIGGLVALIIAGRSPALKILCLIAIFLALVGIAIIIFIRNPRRARARKAHEQALREAQARAAQEAAEPPAGDYTEPPVPSPEPAEPPAQDYAGKEPETKD